MPLEGITFRKGTNRAQSAINTVLKMRGIGGTLLPIGGGRIAMMREADSLLSISERNRLVSSRANSTAIFYPGAELAVFGRRCTFLHNGRTVEALVGLKNNPESIRILDGAIGKRKYTVNPHGMIVGVDLEGSKDVINAINRELGVETSYGGTLRLLDLPMAEALVRIEAAFFYKNEISGFWTRDLHQKTKMPALQFTSAPLASEGYDPATTNKYICIVLGREIDPRLA